MSEAAPAGEGLLFISIERAISLLAPVSFIPIRNRLCCSGSGARRFSHGQSSLIIPTAKMVAMANWTTRAPQVPELDAPFSKREPEDNHRRIIGEQGIAAAHSAFRDLHRKADADDEGDQRKCDQRGATLRK